MKYNNYIFEGKIMKIEKLNEKELREIRQNKIKDKK